MLTDNEIAILDTHEFGCVWYWDDKLRFARAIEAAATEPLLQRIAELEAKLAQQQGAEPAAFSLRFKDDPRLCLSTVFDTETEAVGYAETCSTRPEVVPLYAHPAPKQVPLTDAQIKASCKQTWVFETARQWVRMVEAAHGITGETK